MRTKLIEGNFVNLRIAEERDAEFTLAARQNEEKNRFIPRVNVTLEQQKNWIKRQCDSEDCYFFVVERKDGEKIGTFSLYNIDGTYAESGRLVMLGNQMESLETGVLFNRFSFDSAKMELVHSEIDAENNAAIGFSERLGGVCAGEYIDEKTNRKMLIYHATESNFNKALPRLNKIIAHFSANRKEK